MCIFKTYILLVAKALTHSIFYRCKEFYCRECHDLFNQPHVDEHLLFQSFDITNNIAMVDPLPLCLSWLSSAKFFFS